MKEESLDNQIKYITENKMNKIIIYVYMPGFLILLEVFLLHIQEKDILILNWEHKYYTLVLDRNTNLSII